MPRPERRPTTEHYISDPNYAILRANIDTLTGMCLHGQITYEQRNQEIAKMPGFQLIQERGIFPDGDCWSYALGIENDMRRLSLTVVNTVSTYDEIQLANIRPADLVLYLGRDEHNLFGNDVRHVAIVDSVRGQDVSVRSRWGHSDPTHIKPVFRHPIFELPTSYGEKIVILRRPQRR